MVNDWNKALEEAIVACLAREQDARSRVTGLKSPLQVNVLSVMATEARNCAEVIAKLKK